MHRRCAFAWCALVLLAGSLVAFEVPGTIQKVDADKGTVVIKVNGQERTVKADKGIKVLDKEGKDLKDGLKSKELKKGVEATFTIEQEKNQPVVKAVRLGKKRRRRIPRRRVRSASSRCTEMTAQDKYKGEDGGLYGGGKNEPPEAHRAAAQTERPRPSRHSTRKASRPRTARSCCSRSACRTRPASSVVQGDRRPR